MEDPSIGLSLVQEAAETIPLILSREGSAEAVSEEAVLEVLEGSEEEWSEKPCVS